MFACLQISPISFRVESCQRHNKKDHIALCRCFFCSGHVCADTFRTHRSWTWLSLTQGIPSVFFGAGLYGSQMKFGHRTKPVAIRHAFPTRLCSYEMDGPNLSAKTKSQHIPLFGACTWLCNWHACNLWRWERQFTFLNYFRKNSIQSFLPPKSPNVDNIATKTKSKKIWLILA